VVWMFCATRIPAGSATPPPTDPVCDAQPAPTERRPPGENPAGVRLEVASLRQRRWVGRAALDELKVIATVHFMASPSLAFQRIKEDALNALRSVPAGRVTSYGEIGRRMDVMARHIAYLVTMLTPAELETVPWHRVVGEDGVIGPAQRKRRGAEQIRRLRAEGVEVDARRRIGRWQDVAYRWPPAASRPGDEPRGPYSDPRTPLLFAKQPGPARRRSRRPAG